MNFTLFNFSLGLYNMLLVLMINKLSSNDKTLEEEMEEINNDLDKIESITDTEIKSRFYKVVEFMTNNMVLSYFIIYLMLSIPFINILMFISLSINLIRKFIKR